MKIAVVLLMLFFVHSIHGQTIVTVAGTGSAGLLGDNGPATAATILSFDNIVFDKIGNYYFSDILGCKIRKINTLGIITTVAGTGAHEYGGDGGISTAAQLKFPEGLAIDSLGNLLISDHQNYRIRRIDAATGIISTIAGSGVMGDMGDGGPATAACFFPAEILFDKHGNLYISDNTYHKIRKVNQYGMISTYAGTGFFGFSGDGGPATAAMLWSPTNMTIDSLGNLFFVDEFNYRIRKIDTSGIISTYAGTGVASFNGDNIMATAAQMAPGHVVFYKGKMYISDWGNHMIRTVDEMGVIHTIAGTGVGGFNGDNISATATQLYTPSGMAFDSCSNLYFGDVDNHRIRKLILNPFCAPDYVSNVAPVSDVKLFPNPVNDQLHIDIATSKADFVLSDLTGRVLQQGCVSKGSNVLVVEELPIGLYIIKLTDIDGKIMRSVFCKN